MNRLTKLTGMMLMLFIAGSLSLNAQRGMRGMMDSTRMNGPGNRMDARQFRDNGRADSLRMRDMRPARGHMKMDHMNRGMHYMKSDCFGNRTDRPGTMRVENIPNLTEKQKQEIADLRKTQQSEMQKLRDEMTSKMQEMRETNRKNVLDLLTDEQKKAFESDTDQNASSSKVK